MPVIIVQRHSLFIVNKFNINHRDSKRFVFKTVQVMLSRKKETKNLDACLNEQTPFFHLEKHIIGRKINSNEISVIYIVTCRKYRFVCLRNIKTI